MKKFLLVVFAFLFLGASVNATPINFNDYTAKIGQPGSMTTQGIDGEYKIYNSGSTLRGNGLSLSGDIWVNFEKSLRITEKTIMSIDVRDWRPTGEIVGLQFLDSFDAPTLDGSQAFAFAGTQTNFGIQDFRTVGTDWTSFEIEVGTYFTGNFGGIVFFSDDDTPQPDEALSKFRNFEISPVPEPATMLLFGFGLLGLAGLTRKKQ